jgi:taurine dioxygenase
MILAAAAQTLRHRIWAEEKMAPSPQQSTGTNTYVEVVPLTLHIGAEIRGVDLSKPLPPEQLKQVRDAFLKWNVVFFRGQNLDHAQHVAMARQFGEPTIGHAVFGHVEGCPEVYSVAKNRTVNENREQMMVTPWSGWHTDITAAVNPPCASILRGVTIPPYGGDTVLDQSRCRLSGAVADDARLCRRVARGPRERRAREP